jgi:hypothetical protein
MKRTLNLMLGLLLFSFCYAQKQDIKLNLVKGETYAQRSVTNMAMQQSIAGQDIKIGVTINGLMAYKVTDIKDTVYTLSMEYKSLSMKMDSPMGGGLDMNSDNNDPNNILSSVAKTLLNKPLTVKLSNKGKVLEVTGSDALYEGMFEKFPQIQEAQKQQVKDQLSQSFGEKSLRSSLETSLSVFPRTAVAKGDKWTVGTLLESSISGNIQTVYELKDVTATDYILVGVGQVSADSKNGAVESNGMKVGFDLSGTSNTEVVVDKKTGWIKNQVVKQAITGTAKIEDNPQIPGGMSFKITLNTETIVTDK